jgi:hypothetical protein
VLRGCEARPKDRKEIEGKIPERCPKRLFLDQPEDMAEIFWWYGNYKKGLLPVGGGILDQPALMMELFMVIDGAVATIEHDQMEKLRQT